MAKRPFKLGPVLLVASLAFLGAWTLRYNVRDNLIPRNFATVGPGVLYRAGRLTPAQTEAVVRENKIKTIIDLGAYLGQPINERIAQRSAEALGVARFTFDLVGDGTGDPNDYVQALRIIAKPEFQPVLVHCAAGAQRTSACVMFYREISEGKPVEETFSESLEHKHDPKDNPALRAYVLHWRKQIAAAFRDGSTIPYNATVDAEGRSALPATTTPAR
jgi:protein tyrosine/serine phosphatase